MTRRTTAAFVAVLMLSLGAPATSGAQAPDVIDSAVRAYTERGDAREAIRQLGTALDAGVIPPAFETRARVYLAHAFLALGDTVSALPHIRTALNAEPCLMPAPDLTPPSWGALYQRNRPDVSCGTRGVLSTLQSMVVPGWGQLSVGRTGAAAYFFGATALAGGGAYLFNSRAADNYAKYQSSTDPLAVPGLFADAESGRRLAVILGGIAGAIYVWNVVDALVSGISHDRELLRVRELSALPIVVPTSDGAMVALRIPLN